MNVNNKQSTYHFVLILILIFSSLVLRLHKINDHDLWFDELGTRMFTQDNLTKMADSAGISRASLFLLKLKKDPQPPAYYFFVYFYSIIGGQEASLRMLSVFFSVLSLIVFYKLAMLLFDFKTGIIGLCLLGLSPFHLWYAQEARMFATACFLVVLTVYFLFKALISKKNVYWFCYTVSAVVSFLLSYFFCFLIIASAGIFLFREYRLYWRQWLASSLIITVFFMFNTLLLSSQVNFIQTSFWLLPPSFKVLILTGGVFILGYTATLSLYSVAFIFFTGLFGYGFFSAYKIDRKNAIVLALFLLIPLMFIFIISQIWEPIYIYRQLIIFSPLYYLFIAKGISSLPKKSAVVTFTIALALVVSSVINYYNSYSESYVKHPRLFPGVLQKKKYATLLQYLDRNYKQGDIVAVTDIQSYIMLLEHIISNDRIYGRNYQDILRLFELDEHLTAYEKNYLGIPMSEIHLPVKENTLKFYQPLADAGVELINDGLNGNHVQRIWLFSSSWQKEPMLVPNSAFVRSYMDTNYKKEYKNFKDGIFIELYLSNKTSYL